MTTLETIYMAIGVVKILFFNSLLGFAIFTYLFLIDKPRLKKKLRLEMEKEYEKDNSFKTYTN